MLANSMLGLLPSYDMQVVWYPQYICEFIDRCIRGFIWRGNNSRRVHLVNWDVITEPKEGGGLRVRVARNHNINILGKLVWDLLHLNNQLWVSLLRDKYFLDENLFMTEGRKGSMTWNAIMKVMKHFQEGLE